MNLFRLENGVDRHQQRYDVPIRITDATYFEKLSIDIDGLQFVGPDPEFAKCGQLTSCYL